jgi:hypothetical protein
LLWISEHTETFELSLVKVLERKFTVVLCCSDGCEIDAIEIWNVIKVSYDSAVKG